MARSSTRATVCASCGAPIDQPATGRPRRFCGQPCRQAGTLVVRRTNSLLLTAERELTKARAKLAARPYGDNGGVAFWTGERDRLAGELAELLADDGT